MSDAPIRIGHPDTEQNANSCGCCDGTALATSGSTENRPHLSHIDYRTGRHAQFKSSMLTALNSADYAALADLGTRDNDDFSVALIDAWASVCEILSFYQERNANEAYMETATERLSIGEIARLIGYRLHPGAAAEADLVLTLEDPPGADADVQALTIPAGTRVQSQPGPEELPQTFETLEELSAQVSWNILYARQDQYLAPRTSDYGIWLEGQATGLTQGDVILIVSPQRSDTANVDFDVDSNLWSMRRIAEIDPDKDLDRTWVSWNKPLNQVSPGSAENQSGHRFFVLRDRASLFGFNAPHPKVFSAEQLVNFGFTVPPDDWTFTVNSADSQLNLDLVYKSIIKDSWLVVTQPGSAANLYRVTDVTDDGLSSYAISGRSSRVTLDTDEALADLPAVYRGVSVYAGSQELTIAESPIMHWVSGTEFDLDTPTDLPEDRRVMVTGRRPQVISVAISIPLTAEDGTVRAIPQGTRLDLMSQPIPLIEAFTWTLQDADGFVGSVNATPEAFDLVYADDSSEIVSEIAIIDHIDISDPVRSRVFLQESLAALYDPRAFLLHGNIAPASHGEGTSEILGSGNPAVPFQKFLLKQNPVTQRLAATETGIESTLSVRVDGVQWTEKPDLYARGSADRVFTTALSDGGETLIQFGDGLSGARLQPGRDNIVADYRRGLGRAGNVRKGQLSLLLDRPLGLTEAVNLLPASGGDDAESSKDARRNAPIYTLTLGRVVSITDYRDFALGYPGISKADSRWIWTGETRRIIVTVAGLDGAALPVSGPTLPALLAAYRALGDPLVLVDTVSYQPTYFRLAMKVSVDPAYVSDTVLANVETALRAAFSFEIREFAEKVALSAIAATAHDVAGVRAVDIDSLYRESGPQSTIEAHANLQARTGRLHTDGTFLPAEILTLSPDPLDALVVMT